MSPSESQLRAALRAGEGQPVDAELVIAHARTVRHNRRVRVGSIAAAVIAVAGIGTGIAALNGDGTSSPHDTAGGAIAGDKAAAPEATGPRGAPGTAGTAGAAGGSHGGDNGAASCPDEPIRLMLPGGGGTGQFGGSGPLFAGPVDSIRACGYAAASLGGRIELTGSTVLLGRDAADVATSLNAAAVTRSRETCPLPVGPVRELVLYPVASSGAELAPVVVTYNGCGPWATNGTAVRYDWTPPAATSALLNRLTLATPGLPSVPGPRPIEPSGSPKR